MAWRKKNENGRANYSSPTQEDYDQANTQRSGGAFSSREDLRERCPPSNLKDDSSSSQSSSASAFHRRRDNIASGSRDVRPTGYRPNGYRPPGLRGREIGMYYRNLALKNPRKRETEIDPPTVSLDARKEQKISRMLGLNTLRESPIVNDEVKELKTPPGAGRQSSTTTLPEAECHLSRPINESERIFLKKSDDWWADVAVNGVTVNAGSSVKDPSTDANSKTASCKTEEFIEVQKKKSLKTEKSLTSTTATSQEGLSDNAKTDPANKYNHIQDSVFKRKFLQNLTGSIESNLAGAVSKPPPLIQNNVLDLMLKEALLKKQSTSVHYKKMMDFRTKLPSYNMRSQILDLVERNQVVVISGETGCGKTTQVGQFILDNLILQGKGSTCHIVCTQPRRISATSVAQRVADERDEELGADSVGFQIRLERKLPRKQGSLVFCTTGIMLQHILIDPGLTSISHLILDEIHERDVITDFVITLLKTIIPKRPDLKIILMSATMNSEQFSAYFENCPSLNIPGFTFPVREYYLEDALEMTEFRFPLSKNVGKKWQKWARSTAKEQQDFADFVRPYVRLLESEGHYSRPTLDSLCNPESEQISIPFIAELIHYICAWQGEGAILVFLPGWSEISKLHSTITSSSYFSGSDFLVIPLHSLMSTTVQRSVFDRPRPGVRKIVLATNIAETSITIEDVVFVIDAGKIKMTNFDVEHNISTLKAEWVSLANAKQRKGRAGRVRNGVCYHLFTKCREMTLANYPLPEMLRTRLDQVLLQIKILQIGLAKPFLEKVMNPPDVRAVDLSIKMLTTLNALDCDENLTPLGYHLAKLPMDPQTGKMILMAAIFSCVDPILSIAAALNFKDPFVLPLGKEAAVQAKKLELSKGTKSDHLVLMEAVMQWERAKATGWDHKFCRDNFLAAGTLKMIQEMKGQLAGYLKEMNFLSSQDPKAKNANLNSGNVNLLKAIICAGLYPNVAQLWTQKRSNKEPLVFARTPEDGRVSLHLRSINEKVTFFESHFLLYHLKLKSTEIMLHDTTMIHPLPLLFFGQGVRCSVKDGYEVIYVDQHIYFRCCQSTANVVRVLRSKLDGILEQKVSHPGSIDWNSAKEGAILREIIGLISCEGCDEYNVKPGSSRQ